MLSASGDSILTGLPTFPTVEALTLDYVVVPQERYYHGLFIILNLFPGLRKLELDPGYYPLSLDRYPEPTLNRVLPKCLKLQSVATHNNEDFNAICLSLPSTLSVESLVSLDLGDLDADMDEPLAMLRNLDPRIKRRLKYLRLGWCYSILYRGHSEWSTYFFKPGILFS